jgi:hypothetical protein
VCVLDRLTKTMMVGALALTGCKTKGDTSAPKTVAIESSSRWQKSDLTVCWESEADDMPKWKSEIKKHIVANFDRTVIHLVGWDSCKATDSPDIRVFIYDSPAASQKPLLTLRSRLQSESYIIAPGHPRTRARGVELSGMEAGLVLTSEFTDVDPGLIQQAQGFNSTGKHNLILGVALHEFGHAIGLGHEDAHPDRTCETFAEDIGYDDAVSSYNPDSVMSRCYYRNVDYNKQTLNFNQGDIDGIAAAYKHLR